MSVRVLRDFDTDEVVIRIKRGKEPIGFANFLNVAAEALENGKLLPTNPNPDPRMTIGGAADSIRSIATKIKANNV